MLTAQTLVSTLEDLTAYIENSEARIRGGEELDMSGVDAQVQDICDRIESSPSDVKQAAEPHLAKMILSLEKLADALEIQLKDAEAAEGSNEALDEDE